MVDLETWLRRENMSTVAFAEKIPCSKVVLWKVKRGMTIDPKIASAIMKLTGGEVVPLRNPRGRPRL